MLLMTCTIREGADDKVFRRIRARDVLKRRSRIGKQLKIGLLGMCIHDFKIFSVKNSEFCILIIVYLIVNHV